MNARGWHFSFVVRIVLFYRVANLGNVRRLVALVGGHVVLAPVNLCRPVTNVMRRVVVRYHLFQPITKGASFLQVFKARAVGDRYKDSYDGVRVARRNVSIRCLSFYRYAKVVVLHRLALEATIGRVVAANGNRSSSGHPGM